MSLNNFVNAVLTGYLDLLSKTVFGQRKWEPKYVVLTNIGLLYFDDPSKEPPEDLFPVLDGDIKSGDIVVTGLDYDNTFKIVNSRKEAVFRCSSSQQLREWKVAIVKLQAEAQKKKRIAEKEEERRITMVQKLAAAK